MNNRQVAFIMMVAATFVMAGSLISTIFFDRGWEVGILYFLIGVGIVAFATYSLLWAGDIEYLNYHIHRKAEEIECLTYDLERSRAEVAILEQKKQRQGKEIYDLQGGKEYLSDELDSCETRLEQVTRELGELEVVKTGLVSRLIEGMAREAYLESSLLEASKPKIIIVRVPWHSGSRPSRTKKKGNQNKKRGRNSRFINRNRR